MSNNIKAFIIAVIIDILVGVGFYLTNTEYDNKIALLVGIFAFVVPYLVLDFKEFSRKEDEKNRIKRKKKIKNLLERY